MRTTGLCLALLATANLTLIASPAFAEGPAPAAAPADGTVMVHINSSSAVTLQRRSSATAAWETACTSPCDTRVPVGDEYQVAATSGAPSKIFRLDTSRGNVTLDVSPGDPSKKQTGMYVTIGGGVLALAGIITMIAGAKPSNTFPADGTTGLSNTNVLWIGGALLFAGIATGIYGGSMWVNGGNTSVDGDVSKAGPARGSNDAPKVAQQPIPSTPQFVVPVFSGTF
jgi:hypothetical protein